MFSSRFTAYATLIRLPGLAGLSMAPVFGAICQIDVGVNINIQILSLLFLIGIIKSIYGFVLNDYIDIEIDRLSQEADKRPLVTGAISKQNALTLCVSCVIFTFLIVFLFFFDDSRFFYYALLIITLAAIIGTIYNVYGKKFVGSDVFAASADALFVLVGAFLVTENEMISIFTWTVFLLYFTQIFFMNAVVGGIKDADHDYKFGVRNIAYRFGVRMTKENRLTIPTRFKIFGLTIRIFSSLILFVPFVFFGKIYPWYQLIMLLIIIVFTIFLSDKLLNSTTYDKSIMKILSMQGILRFMYVPLMLIPLIGIVYSVFLILVPILWYMLFISLMNRKPFHQMT
jgi:4-hydroxybenzoate polyprenyltransferase